MNFDKKIKNQKSNNKKRTPKGPFIDTKDTSL